MSGQCFRDMPIDLLTCKDHFNQHVRGGACLRSGGYTAWTYCPLCNRFAMAPIPGLSNQERRRLEEDVRSYVIMAVERDRTAAAL